ncbi:MAG: two component transcriptional regulator, LuxR family [Rhodospirillales bacterium]|jgi:two-component system nitrate/nitrite response regulator NarL|nr:two component transcriptional regulator, LuxR family [Rhodospirillales bacterium]
MTTSLVLADDHPVVLEGLQGLFRPPDFNILAVAHDGEACLKAVLTHDPDVLVVDHQMPRMTGLEVLASLREQGARTRPIVLTGTLEESRVMEAIRLGARGIVPKDLAARHLLQCVNTVAAGGTWIEHDLLRAALETRPQEALMALLTPREREIVRQVVAGNRNKEIARLMRIGEGTVKMHLHNIYAKLNVGSRTELAVLAQKLGY